MHDLASFLEPVVHENGLHLRHGRAVDAVVRVAPFVGIAVVAGSALRMACSIAGKICSPLISA